MSTYKDCLDNAQKCNVIKRVIEREIKGDLHKIDTALSLKRDFCLNRYNKSTKMNTLNNDHRRCPSLYEAEAINDSKHYYRTKDCVKRCVRCKGALLSALDINKTMCSLCRNDCHAVGQQR
nr:maco-A 63 [Mamestra configurata nucleopolyhedrovirus A]WRQ96468.1 maco-A 63 [Mamestra configurata nucleopolyhedrovirus A]